MKKLLLCAVAVLVLGGCSEDKENGGVGGPETLAGEAWMEVRVDGWELCDEHGRDDLTEVIAPEDADIVAFFEDGTYKQWSEGSFYRTGTWEMKNNILYFDPDKYPEPRADAYAVTELTSSKLVLTEDFGGDGYLSVTYKRVGIPEK